MITQNATYFCAYAVTGPEYVPTLLPYNDRDLKIYNKPASIMPDTRHRFYANIPDEEEKGTLLFEKNWPNLEFNGSC